MVADRAEPRRRPTLEDVARAAGVSRALVSIVMRDVPGASDGTRERVRAVAASLGYRPDARARLLAASRTRLLGVVFNVRHSFHADLLAGLYAAAEAVGYEVVLSGTTPGHDERRAIETLLGYRCDALLLLGPDLPDRLLVETAARLPVVVVGRLLPGSKADLVRVDDAAGMSLAVGHLRALGHRVIAHVDGGPGSKTSARRRGFVTAAEAAGLASAPIVAGGQTAEDGADAAADVMALPDRPTAVVAYNDDCAFGLLEAVRRAGVSIPGDLSVVGYDDGPLSRTPLSALTTVSQDAPALAAQAVRRAVARLEGYAGTDRDVVLQPSLIVRATTAPPRS